MAGSHPVAVHKECFDVEQWADVVMAEQPVECQRFPVTTADAQIVAMGTQIVQLQQFVADLAHLSLAATTTAEWRRRCS